ncbi:calcium-binding protein [Streptomyces sp. NPDC059524]|uniref:calcium-binding protein n=1 Tax=Streptomyces sp. NPDC059524 TaxID=3346856 RepID=UPI003696B07C
MRIRASLVAATMSGAAALTAFVVPAAQADDAPSAPSAADAVAPLVVGEQKSTFSTADAGDIKITKVTVNGNKDVVVGGTLAKSFNIYVTATNPEGIEGVQAFLWHGTDLTSEDGIDGAIIPDQPEDISRDCEYWSETTATCKVTLTATPGVDLYKSSLNGKWNVYAGAVGKDLDVAESDVYKNHWVKRASHFASFNASPEPVAKGKPITLSGGLSRISWTYLKYYGYAAQPVQVQFKKAGSSSYTTVKTVNSSSTGQVKTTITASTDGTWRLYYPGNSATSTATSSADYVDVR